MYLQLGDIVFEGLIGFESFNDTIEATYAQHELINRKPRLQRTGDGLREFTGKIALHAAFCIPEEQYEKLEAKRSSGEIMPLIYGNGKYEGDFILKSITRSPGQTDPSGAYVLLTLDITLLEAGFNQTAALRRAQAKAGAFAVTANRPLPVNSDVASVNNPALEVANNNKVAGQAGTAVSEKFDAVDKQIAAVPDPFATSIPPAQKFMDVVPSMTTIVNRSMDDLENALIILEDLTGTNPTINIYSPTLVAAIAAANVVLSAGQTLIANLSGLPNPVTNSGDAITILGFQKDTVTLGEDLVTALKTLNTSSVGVTAALAIKATV